MYYNDFNPLLFLSFLIVCYLLQGLAYYKFFQKAGEKGWTGFIPFYNYYIHNKIIGRPVYWVLLLIIPVINFFVALTMLLDLLKSFGRYTYKDQVLGVIFAPIYLLIVAYGDAQYLGKATQIPKIKKSFSKETFEAVVFAVFCAAFIRWVFMEAYVIPTPSMENSLLVGDFLFVSKAEYGPRTPYTPIQMPLTHQKIWMTDIPSYTSLVKLPSWRLPSLGKVERNDVVVFNWPAEADHPKDLRMHYVKRCIAVAGDVLEIKNGDIFINGEQGKIPEKVQYSYFIQSDQTIRERVWQDLDVSEYQHYPLQGKNGYLAMVTNEAITKLKEYDFVTSIEKQAYDSSRVEQDIFPDYRFFRWNRDNYGPLTIPSRGMEIEITEESLAMYGSTIRDYEDLDGVEIDVDKLSINDQNMTTYTFKKNYYFMMGDNRHNSLDSRYWGFVCEDFIVGEASFIWMSFDNKQNFFKKIRWDRIFKKIE